ncbi:succinylglutamate desuccinylase/aspartoacylase family protein [Thalassomonas actiniarum]|uniref:Succinylglutamate desuccinylase/aspartoacylase family protein n=1 Tax=Thalassomonas actiniarum TaxID=485447 RepID=A0AAE9YRT8_9GAMM|nr:succinylglutamate desuccinylase/aspartoacylase family protein [Thalassomonas actiniarum]WDD99537.1 succinylglutamate desuccinylase/aspartoacylase family protein [Thalassomonas actiniarum]
MNQVQKNLLIKEVLHMGEMASGAALTVPVYRLKGQGSGPGVYIQANMHGAEVQGNAVIYQLLELLQGLTLLGNITLVPYANPVGCNHKNGEYTLGRFDPITGVNWNRMYHFNEQQIPEFSEQHQASSIEVIEQAFRELLLADIADKLDHNVFGLTTGQRIAYQLQKMAHKADLVLDLHTGPISSKHLYCPEYAIDSARYFDIPHTIVIPNSFDGAMDEATFCPWWTLQQAFGELGRELDFNKESFTVELGSQEQIDLDVAYQDALSILSYLQYKGVIADASFQPQAMTRYACYLKDYKAFYSPMGGMVDYLATFGEPLAAGEPIARILRMDNYGDGDALHYLSLDRPVIPILHFASASVNQGTELYKVFCEYFEL